MTENEVSQLLVGDGLMCIRKGSRVGDRDCAGRSVADVHLAGYQPVQP